MKILAIDTTTKIMCIGLFDGEKIYEYSMKLGPLQSDLLVPAIKRLVDALKWRMQEIDYFACGLGPGSFTGIRVGLSAIKGFAWSLNKPVAGISTLELMARNAAEFPGMIMPAVDAKRNLVYCAVFTFTRGKVKRLMPDQLIGKEEFIKKIKPNSVIFGDALDLYKQDILRRAKNPLLLEQDYWYPQGHNLVYAALEMIKAKKTKNAFNIKPIYLYPDECQIRK